MSFVKYGLGVDICRGWVGLRLENFVLLSQELCPIGWP